MIYLNYIKNKEWNHQLDIIDNDLDYSHKIRLIVKNYNQNKNELDKLLKKCNVFISKDKKTLASHSDHTLFIEENDMPDVTDIVYQKYKGILYHITSKENAIKILKYGLEPRSETKRSWHPKRIYFINGKAKLSQIEDLQNQLSQYWKTKETSILKINLKKLKTNKIKFFEDPNFKGADAFYTQESIPPYCIQEIYKDDFDKSIFQFFNISDKLKRLYKKFKS